MENEIIELLRELAEKLGTTVEFLWSVLIYQATVSAIKDTIILILYPFLIWGLYRLWIWTLDKFNEYEYEDGPWWFDITFVVTITLTLIFIIMTVPFMFNLYTIPDRLLNPEYWALQQILKEIR